jgi:intracellular multiplication protein IcmK
MKSHSLSVAIGVVVAVWALPGVAGVTVLSGTPDGAPPLVHPIAAPPPTMAQRTVQQTPGSQNVSGESPASGTPAPLTNTTAATSSALPPLPESQAFHDTVQAAMPLTPAQIAALREAINANRQAEEAPLSPATPRIETINARLGVGNPPSISVQSGFVSTLNVVDAYGRPWPIVRYSVGNPKAFTVAIAGNSAAISDLQPYAQSDLALYLKGEAVPLMVALNPGASGPDGGGVVDYAVRLRVNATEPGLPTPVGGMAGGAAYTNTLLSLVQGVPPAGAKKLRVVGDPGRVTAWTWEGPRGPRLLLRAPGTIIAPAWIATMQGAAGIQAWVLPNVRVVTLSRRGEPELIQLRQYQWEDHRHG